MPTKNTDNRHKPSKRQRRQYMPKWLWSAPHNVMHTDLKHFLAFIWFASDRGCREWDWRLAKRFDRHPHTIHRWIRRLLRLGLINVQWTRTRHRTIYRMPFFKKAIWQHYYIANKPHLLTTLRPPRTTAV